MKGLAIALSFSVVILTISCKEKAKLDPSSSFSINGETYHFAGGFLDDLGSNPDLISRNYIFILVTEGIVHDATRDRLLGDGSLLILDINVNSTDDFIPGTFTWAKVRGPNTIVNGFAGTTCNLDNVYCIYEGYAMEGTATVEVSGKTFIVNFTLNLEDGQTTSGYYKGPLARI